MLRSSLCSLRCKAHQLLDTRALASAMLAATTRAPGPVRGGGLAPSSTNSTRPFCSYSSGGSSVLAGSRLRSGVMRALLPMQQQQRRQLLLPPAAAAAAAAGAGAGAQGPQQRARVSTAATASGGGSSSRKGAGSNSSSSGGTARPSAPLLLAVPGIGRAYVDRLAAQGISSIDKLAEAILTQLSRADAAEAFTPAVKHLQVLGIRRADHASRIVRHITARYEPDLHTRLASSEGDALLGIDSSGGADGSSDGSSSGGSGSSSGKGGRSKGASSSPDVTLCVEGNISAGKSTFLQYITAGHEELQQQLGVVHEPVEQWQRVPTVSGGTLNLLDKFYSDPSKYAYSFQNYVFMSRVMQERDSSGMARPVRLMERSVFSDRMVFVRAVNESGWMGDVELAVYDSWFAPLLQTMPELVPDGFIYLKCAPTTCMERLKLRGRSEETTISLDYLEGLHSKHEDWLGAGMHCDTPYAQLARRRQGHSAPALALPAQPAALAASLAAAAAPPPLPLPAALPGGVIQTPAGLLLPHQPSPLLRRSLYFLDSQRSPQEMSPVLHRVPALVLDCDADVLRDLHLQRQVQDTVAEYVRFIRSRKQQLRAQQLRAARGGGGGQHSSFHSVVTSRGGGARSRRGGGTGSGGMQLHTQPGAPQGVQAEATEMVVEAARGVSSDTKLVANCSGVLQAGCDVQQQQQQQGLSSSSASGSLEALTAAAAAAAANKAAAGADAGRVAVSAF